MMTIGINNIGVYIADNLIDNYQKTEKFSIDKSFIDNVTGIRFVAKKSPEQKSSDFCLLAYENLSSKVDEKNLKNIGCICVCTQNGDYKIPQTSAIVHGKLGLSINCAAFDISLGCSGYVYAIHIMKSFMVENSIDTGILFTSDQYSEIIDSSNKDTDLLFGDAATATLLSNKYVFKLGAGVFQTQGIDYGALIKEDEKSLKMEGRRVFNFSLKSIPPLVNKCIITNDLHTNDIDKYLFHQASKYMLEKIAKKMKIEKSKIPFNIKEFGNTVSSTIPILLSDLLNDQDNKDEIIVLCGFGVGLSMAASIIRRNSL